MATTTTTQPNTNVQPVLRPIDWGQWLYRVLATALVVSGLGLLAGETNALAPEWARALALAGPVLVMAVGAGLVVWGWAGGRRSLPDFAVERGHAACGELVAVTGGADLQLRAFAGSSHLAVGQFPDADGPGVDMHGTAVRLTLAPRQTWPDLAAGTWNVAVAKGLPWELDLRSGGGHLELNLRDLMVPSLRLQSAYGNVALTLPAHGPADLRLRLALGDLNVTVPVGLEARLRLVSGPLVNVSVDERRFINVAPGEWMTPLYPTTTQRCTLLVDMSAGDLRVA